MNSDSIIIRCTNCNVKNRIPRSRLNENPVCGKCHAPLKKGGIYDQPVNVTDQTFYDEIVAYPGPVLVDCWAPWCGPCQMITPVLEQLAKEYAGKIKIAKLNVDENPATSSQYNIQSIPTMLIFKAGQNVNRLIGAVPKSEIEKQIHLIID